MTVYSNDQGKDAGAIPVRAVLSLVPVPPTVPPATIAGGAHWDSGVIAASGYRSFAAAATLSQAGSLVIQRYIDPAGLIALGDPISEVMSAATPATVWVNDGQPTASWRVTINNTSGSLGNLTNVALLETA